MIGLDDVPLWNHLFPINTSTGVCAGPISYDRILNEYNKPVGNQVGVGVGVTYSAHANKTQTVNIGKPFRSFGKWFNEEILKNEN